MPQADDLSRCLVPFRQDGPIGTMIGVVRLLGTLR